MPQSGLLETCIQGGDGLLEPSQEDLQTSLEKFLWAERCLLAENSGSLSFSSSNSLKSYRECYFQLLFVIFRQDLTKLNLKEDIAHDKILREILSFQEAANWSHSSFRNENDLIEASVSYVNHHCTFKQDLDADTLSDEKRIQLLSNIRNSLLRLGTACLRQLSPAQYDVPFVSSRAILELQVDTIDAAQAKSLERASHLDLGKSCKAFKTLLTDYKSLQQTNSEQNCLKKLLHIGRINGYLFIAAVKILFETVGIVSGLMKETEFQLQSSESVGSEEAIRYDEALFNFSEAKCSLLSLIEGKLAGDFEETFRQTFYIFVQALFCFLTKMGQRNLDVKALNALEEKVLNVLKGSVLADRTVFVRVMAQFHGYVAERMDAGNRSGEGVEGDVVVDDLMLALFAQNVGHRSISAEDIFLFVSEIKRQRWVSQTGDVCITSGHGAVLRRLNDAVNKFMSVLDSGQQAQVSEISEAHDLCLASLWASRMFPLEMSNHLKSLNRCSGDTTTIPESILDSDLLTKEEEEAIITSSTNMALRCLTNRTESQTSGVCDSSDRDEMTAAGCSSLELVSVSAEIETLGEISESRFIPSDKMLSIVMVKEAGSFPVANERGEKRKRKVRNVRSKCNSVDRPKKAKGGKTPRLRQTLAIIAEAAQILRELKKVRHLFSTVIQQSTSLVSIPNEKEKEEEINNINDNEEKKKDTKVTGLIEEDKEQENKKDVTVTEEKKEEATQAAIEREEEKEIAIDGVILEEEKEDEEKNGIKEVEEKQNETRGIIIEEKEESPIDVMVEDIVKTGNKEKVSRIKGEVAGSKITDRKEKKEKFQKCTSNSLPLRAAQVSEKIFSTSVLVRPSFRPIFQPLPSEPTCVRLDRQLRKRPNSRSPSRQAVEIRDAAFSRLTQAVLRGQHLPVDARPDAFCAEVTSALRSFVSAHQPTPAVVPATPPAAEPKVGRQTLTDVYELEPRGDGSFVTRKKHFQAQPKAPRGATPLYGRCRI